MVGQTSSGAPLVWMDKEDWRVCGMTVFVLHAAAVFWVLCSEMFSMSIKASASSAAMAVLFAAGAAANFVFLSLYSWLQSGAFLVFAAIAGDPTVMHCTSTCFCTFVPSLYPAICAATRSWRPRIRVIWK